MGSPPPHCRICANGLALCASRGRRVRSSVTRRIRRVSTIEPAGISAHPQHVLEISARSDDFLIEAGTPCAFRTVVGPRACPHDRQHAADEDEGSQDLPVSRQHAKNQETAHNCGYARPGWWNRGVPPRPGEAEACTGWKRSSTCVRPNSGFLGRSGWDTSPAVPGLPLPAHIDSRPLEYRDEHPYRRPQTAREDCENRVKRVIGAPDDDGLAGRIYRRACGHEVFGVALPIKPALSCCTVRIRVPAGRLRRGPRHTHLHPFA